MMVEEQLCGFWDTRHRQGLKIRVPRKRAKIPIESIKGECLDKMAMLSYRFKTRTVILGIPGMDIFPDKRYERLMPCFGDACTDWDTASMDIRRYVCEDLWEFEGGVVKASLHGNDDGVG
jgi:hypothetical protein